MKASYHYPSKFTEEELTPLPSPMWRVTINDRIYDQHSFEEAYQFSILWNAPLSKLY